MHKLQAPNRHTCLPDGDTLCLKSSRVIGITDRVKNVRIVETVARKMVDAGQFLTDAFISRDRSERAMTSGMAGSREIVAVLVDTPFDACALRHPNGVYGSARFGEPPASRKIELKCAAGNPERLAERVAPHLVAPEDS